MFDTLHDPVPDGRTGPFRRRRHALRADGSFAFEPLCRACAMSRPLPRPWTAEDQLQLSDRDPVVRAEARERYSMRSRIAAAEAVASTKRHEITIGSDHPRVRPWVDGIGRGTWQPLADMLDAASSQDADEAARYGGAR